MPHQSAILDISAVNANHRQALLLGTIRLLKWSFQYSTENTIVANTIRTAWKWEQEVTLVIEEETMRITSATIHGEVMDIKKRNHKNIETFLQAFQQLQKTYTTEDIDRWQKQLHQSEEELVQAKEQVVQLMEHRSPQPIVTYTIVGLNVLVFIVMTIKGLHPFKPAAIDILNWGGNISSRTLSGEWWRLFTSMFVHIGIVHLVVNMLVLLMTGIYLEVLLGSWRFLLAYLSTGLFASLTSIWWHDPPIVSAGASGAVFGVLGVLLALLTTKLLPDLIRKQLLGSVAIMVIYNLANGLKAGVDNAAHIGGLLSGLLIGYGYYFSLRRQKEDKPRNLIPDLVIAIVTIATTVSYLNVNKRAIVRDDSEAFFKKMEHFSILESMALEAMQPSDTASQQTFMNELRKTALTNWADCVNLMDETENMALPENLINTRTQMKQYASQRVQQTLLYIRALEENSNTYDRQMDSLRSEIDKTVNELRQTLQQLPSISGDAPKRL
ncbi:MAG: rhomboid family intramembrane serine protease [Chitinophagaceae bacterium]|nr:rhomboid family intramembrane serine protease [Chitinophagaceae bacterium]